MSELDSAGRGSARDSDAATGDPRGSRARPGTPRDSNSRGGEAVGTTRIGAAQKRAPGFFGEIVANRYLYALAVPGLVFLAIFAYIPMAGHLIAFKDYSVLKGILGSPWSGFENFEFFFAGPDWGRVTLNTIYLNSLFIVFGLGFAVIIALALNEVRFAAPKRVSQSIIFLPYFISWMAVSMMVYALLNTTDVIDTYSYRALRQLGNFGMASSVVLYQSVMGMVTIIIFNSIVKRIDPSSGLF
jgi:ABC-type polysaccharide transport system permease subunit